MTTTQHHTSDHPVIDSPRLQLRPCAPAHLLAMYESSAEFQRCFGTPAVDGLRKLFVSEEVSPDFLAQLQNSRSADPWVFGFLIVEHESRQVIGAAGFKGPPNVDGLVEIAYAIAPEYEGRGYATEAAGALVAFASNDPRVRMICAHTKQENIGSARVLEKNAFTKRGEVIDPDDGPVWRWERAPQPFPAAGITLP